MDAHASFDAPERLLAESEWLARLARGLVATADDADDLAQDTFAAALAHPPDPERPLRPWLARVAHNLAVRRSVGRARREAREETVARKEALASTADIVERVAMQRTVVEAVLALEEPYRSTLLLRYWDDLAPREIAERMSVPVETVRTRLKRDIAQLRERLDRRHGSRDEWLSVLLPIALTRAPAVTATATTAGLGSIGALLVSISSKVAIAAVVLLIGVVAVREFVGTSASPSAAPQVANAELGANANSDKQLPARVTDLDGATRNEVAVVNAGAASSNDLEHEITCTVLDKLTKAPIAGARVELRTLVFLNQAREEVGSAETDAQGVARLRDPRPREERDKSTTAVEVWAANYAFASVRIPRPSDAERKPEAMHLSVLLAHGTQVRGHVVAADGHTRVAGASVRPTADPVLFEEDLLGGAPEAAISDARGEFVLDRRLAPRSYASPTLYAFADEGIGWTKLGVVDGVEELSDVEVRLRPNAVLNVTLTNPQGAPIADKDVLVQPMFEPLGLPYNEPQPGVGSDVRVLERFKVRTDAKGAAQFSKLVIDDDPVHAANGVLYRVIVGMAQWGGVVKTVALDASKPTELALVLAPLQRFALRGTTLANVRVRGPGGYGVASDEKGHYELRFEIPESRKVEIIFDKPGFLKRVSALELAVGEVERTLAVDLVRGAQLTGLVVDESGHPLAGFLPQLRIGRDVRSARPQQTGDDGKFEFDGLEARRWPLTLFPPHGADESGEEAVDWEGPFALVVDPAESPIVLQFHRREAGRVSLDVDLIDAATQQPVAPIEAELFDSSDNLQRLRREHPIERTLGRLSATHLSRGQWTLSVWTASGARAQRTIDVAQDDGEVALRVEIGAPGRIVGRVVFDDVPAERRPERAFLLTDPTREGQWIPGAGQEPENVTRGYAPLRASQEFAFRFDDVRAFDRVVLMLGPSPYYGRAEVSVPAGGEAQIVVHAKLGGELVLVREGELKTATATLTLRCEGESEPREEMLLIDGERLDLRKLSVPAGRVSWTIRYWSTASRDQPSVIEGEADIAPGATVRAPIRF